MVNGEVQQAKEQLELERQKAAEANQQIARQQEILRNPNLLRRYKLSYLLAPKYKSQRFQAIDRLGQAEQQVQTRQQELNQFESQITEYEQQLKQQEEYERYESQIGNVERAYKLGQKGVPVFKGDLKTREEKAAYRAGAEGRLYRTQPTFRKIADVERTAGAIRKFYAEKGFSPTFERIKQDLQELGLIKAPTAQTAPSAVDFKTLDISMETKKPDLLSQVQLSSKEPAFKSSIKTIEPTPYRLLILPPEQGGVMLIPKRAPLGIDVEGRRFYDVGGKRVYLDKPQSEVVKGPSSQPLDIGVPVVLPDIYEPVEFPERGTIGGRRIELVEKRGAAIIDLTTGKFYPVNKLKNLRPFRPLVGELGTKEGDTLYKGIKIFSKITPSSTPLSKEIREELGVGTASPKPFATIPQAIRIYQEEQEYTKRISELQKLNQANQEAYNKGQISESQFIDSNNALYNKSIELQDKFKSIPQVIAEQEASGEITSQQAFLRSTGFKTTQVLPYFIPFVGQAKFGSDITIGGVESVKQIKSGDVAGGLFGLGSTALLATFLGKSLVKKEVSLGQKSFEEFRKLELKSVTRGVGLAGLFGGAEAYSEFKQTGSASVAAGTFTGVFVPFATPSFAKIARPYVAPRQIDIIVGTAKKPQVGDIVQKGENRLSQELLEVTRTGKGAEATGFGTSKATQAEARAGQTIIRLSERQILLAKKAPYFGLEYIPKPALTVLPKEGKAEFIYTSLGAGLEPAKVTEPKSIEFKYTKAEVQRNFNRTVKSYMKQGLSKTEATRQARTYYPILYQQDIVATFRLTTGLKPDRIVFDIMQETTPIKKGATFAGKIPEGQFKGTIFEGAAIKFKSRTGGKKATRAFEKFLGKEGMEPIKKPLQTIEEYAAEKARILKPVRYVGETYRKVPIIEKEGKIVKVAMGRELIGREIYNIQPTERVRVGITEKGEKVFERVSRTPEGKELVFRIGKIEEANLFRESTRIEQTVTMQKAYKTKSGMIKYGKEITITPKRGQKSKAIAITGAPFKRRIEKIMFDTGEVIVGKEGKLISASPKILEKVYRLKEGKELTTKEGKDLETDLESYALLAQRELPKLPSREFIRIEKEGRILKSERPRILRFYNQKTGSYEEYKLFYAKTGRIFIRGRGFKRFIEITSSRGFRKIREQLPDFELSFEQPIISKGAGRVPYEGEYPSYVGGGRGVRGGASEYDALINQANAQVSLLKAMGAFPTPTATISRNVMFPKAKSLSIEMAESRLFPVIREETKIELEIQNKIESRLEPKLRIEPVLKVEPTLRTEPVLMPKLIPRIRLEPKLEPKLRIEPTPEVLIVPELTPRIIPIPRPPYRPTPVGLGKGKGRKYRKRRELVGAYTILLKRRGKFVPVRTGLPRGRALRFGSERAVRELSRQFKIMQSGVTEFEDIAFRPSERTFRAYKVRGGRRVALEPDRFIQRISANLQTREEKALIKAAKYGLR